MQIINVKDAKQALDNGNMLLIDVRQTAEYEQAHIPGAQLIPLDQLKLSAIHNPNRKPLIFHCHSGKRSLLACQQALSQDPSLPVYSLDGGILAWTMAGFPIQSSAPARLSLERQTQVVAGSLILLGMGLGYAISPLFYWIPTVVGGGLCFAGLSGWCGTTLLLAKLPWNRASKP